MVPAQPTRAGGSSGDPPRELWVSLNTPVVTIAQLPVGPALAGVAVHAGPEGPRLTLALRSVRVGRVALFRGEESWRRLRDPDLVRDAAISFAEGMGFLFDDPVSDPREAAETWSRLVAGAAAAPAGPAVASLWPEEAATAPSLSKFRFAPQAGAPRGRVREVFSRLLSCF